ncbi:hypothetical protein [Planctobacterium marinum]|uniref:hypothetical protein n=1 Tax=Planctobacterium marinum TaxID=1631968 RepID=UPI001E655931|nr:hypothetical protein [Planctobacterium marinum]MCC2604090.1 hypothetical protein [Planctobacterium marinum]
MSNKDANYSEKLKRSGIVKITLRVPEEFRDEFFRMAKFCRDYRDYYPDICRSKTKGTIKAIGN